MWFKKLSLWIEAKWIRFEAWVATWLPGMKTKITTALGVLGSTAFLFKDWLDQASPVISQLTNNYPWVVPTATLVLFTLAYWFHGLGERIDVRTAS